MGLKTLAGYVGPNGGLKVEGMGDGDPIPVSNAVSYKGGQKLTPNGSSTAATLPAGTNYVLVYAEGGKIYWEINPSGNASADSPGYCPDGSMRVIGPLSNLTSLKVFGTGASTYAHLEYFSDM